MAQFAKEQIRAAQIEKAIAVGETHTASQRLAIAGYFDAVSNKVVIEFESGAEYQFPTQLVQGLENASKAELTNIEISPSGLGIHWPDIDVDFSIPHLLEGIYGTQQWMTSLEIERTSESTSTRNFLISPIMLLQKYWVRTIYTM